MGRIMTREEFIELSKTALAPALKGRRRPDGTVEHVDDIGQIHGSWGGLAVQPENDTYEILVHA